MTREVVSARSGVRMAGISLGRYSSPPGWSGAASDSGRCSDFLRVGTPCLRVPNGRPRLDTCTKVGSVRPDPSDDQVREMKWRLFWASSLPSSLWLEDVYRGTRHYRARHPVGRGRISDGVRHRRGCCVWDRGIAGYGRASTATYFYLVLLCWVD